MGMVAWALRYVFFAYGNVESNYWMRLIAGIVIHGIVCYDFFFLFCAFTGQIYTDNWAGERFKQSADAGIYYPGYIWGWYADRDSIYFRADKLTIGKRHQLLIIGKTIWLIPGGIAAVVLILFMLFFTDKNRTETQPGLDIEEPSPSVEI